jgi:signal transduction histidine kinase
MAHGGSWDTSGGLGQVSLEQVTLTLLRGPFTARTWRGFASLLLSLLAGAYYFLVTVVALAAAALTRATTPARLRAGKATSGAVRLPASLARFDRWRLRRLNGRDIGERAPLPPSRVAVYHLVRLPAAAALVMCCYIWWVNSGSLALLPLIPTQADIAFFYIQLGHVALTPGGVAVGVIFGIVFLFVGAQVLRATAALDAALAHALLGESRASVEIARLTQARALAVEAAENERRRIERDLHDSFQPHLVSLAAEIGLAIARFDRDPASARSILGQAHKDAKAVLVDLRGVIRGLHPPVLDEHGLDAALSGLVIGCPVPVAIDVSLIRRPDSTREAIAYFVAAESITNITKHANARKAAVTITDSPGPLTITVEDDGQGGARAEPGGGLAGLRARVAAVDGTLTVISPPGGPTRVEAVLP